MIGASAGASMRARAARRFVTATLVAVAIVMVAPRAARAQLGIDIGATAPDVAVETLDGATARLAAAFAGKPAVIEFWATWCPNCRQLEPALQAAQRKHGTTVAFIGVAVSVNQSPERVKRYVAEHLTGFTHFYDRKGDAVGDYDVPATSYIVVLDRAGKVVYTGLGGDQDIEAAIQKALRSAPAAPQPGAP